MTERDEAIREMIDRANAYKKMEDEGPKYLNKNNRTMKAYIIIGHYLQEEGYQVARAYTSEEQAKKDLALIESIDVAGKKWSIIETELVFHGAPAGQSDTLEDGI